MFFQVICLATLAVFQLATGKPLQDEEIKPLDLAYTCASVVIEEDDKDPAYPEKSGVLLIHGLGDTRDTWKSSLSVFALETKRKVCAVDLRNHGDSPWNNDQVDNKAMVADIDLFVDTHNLRKVNVIGHSIGGKVAMNFALKYPKRVNSLIVEDMNSTNHPQGHADLLILTLTFEKEAFELVPEGSTVEEAQDIIADYINKKYIEHGLLDVLLDETMKRQIKIRCDGKKCRGLTNIDAIIKGAKNMDTFLGKSIGLYEGPTMFLYGTESHGQVWKDEKNILKLFPNAKLVGVEGAGHQIHGNYREFNDEVIKFLNKLEK